MIFVCDVYNIQQSVAKTWSIAVRKTSHSAHNSEDIVVNYEQVHLGVGCVVNCEWSHTLGRVDILVDNVQSNWVDSGQVCSSGWLMLFWV